MKFKESARTFTVRYTRPKTISYANSELREFQYNHCSVVVAMNALSACVTVAAEFPDATILSAQPGPIGPTLIALGCIE
jgi:hypothetical protein